MNCKTFFKIFFSSLVKCLSIINLSSIIFYRQGIVNRQQIVNRQSSIVNISSAGRKIHLFCAVFRLFLGIRVALCYLCMRDAWRKVLHFLAFKLFLNFLKKYFFISGTFVDLHRTKNK